MHIGQNTRNLGSHKESRSPEVRMTAIEPTSRSWATKENLQACSFSSYASFFECERQCDVDPCCTGFGFLNVSQLKGNSENSPLACIQNFAVTSMISHSQHLLMAGGEE